MGKSSSNDELTIRNQFDRICKLALKGEAADYYRHIAYRQKHEVLFSELSQKELDSIFGVDKLVTVSKAQLLESLTEEEKAIIRRVFLAVPLPEHVQGACLLLPRSFVLDGLMDQPTQDAMFAAVAKKYCTEPLFIKTHPRDTTDYSKLFPTAVILPRTMPSEVLNFCLPFKFQRAVTVQSWVLRGFTAAEEKVFVGLEEAEKLVQG